MSSREGATARAGLRSSEYVLTREDVDVCFKIRVMLLHCESSSQDALICTCTSDIAIGEVSLFFFSVYIYLRCVWMVEAVLPTCFHQHRAILLTKNIDGWVIQATAQNKDTQGQERDIRRAACACPFLVLV